MMKIVQSNKAYFPHVGGIETVVQQLAEGFVTRHQASSQVIVCNDTNHTNHINYNDVKVTRVGSIGRIASLPISPSYGRTLLHNKGEILQIHEPFLLGSLTYLANLNRARRQYSRLVIWWHSDIVRQRAIAPIYTPLLNKILNEADAVIAATPHHITSSPFLSRFHKKCHIIHYGVDLNRFVDTPEIDFLAHKFKKHYAKPIILFTGRLVYYKGVQYLAEAMRNIPQAHLIIVGKGPLQSELEHIAATCPDNITFFPFLPEPDLVAMYKACDIFVLPSIENSEAFGIVQAEAMACGKPVITCDLPTGVTYVNQHNYTGIVVPKRNPVALAVAIVDLLNDHARREQLGYQARKRVQELFTIEQMVDQTVKLYKDLLEMKLGGEIDKA
jgi:glycosyltransferase involved in cell wall biosynthesis